MIRPEEHSDNKSLAKAIAQERDRRYEYNAKLYHRDWLWDYQCAVKTRQWFVHREEGASDTLVATRRKPQRARITVDKMGPLIDRAAASFHQSSPTAVHIPVSSEPDDIDAAAMCDFADEYLWRASTLADNYSLLGDYVPLWGTAFWITEWNADWGEEVLFDLHKEALEALDAGDSPTVWSNLINKAGGRRFVRFRMGKPEETVEPPHTIFLNFGATSDPRTWTDFIRTKIVPMSWFEENYPGADVKPCSLTSKYHFISPMTGFGRRVALPQEEEGKWGLFTEYRMVPTKKFPRGLVVLVGGEDGTLLHKGESDFPDGRLGLHAVYWKRDPLSPYGIGLSKQLRNLQREYNQGWSTIATYRDKMHGRWLSPAEAGVNFTDDVTEIIQYELGALMGHDVRVPPLEAVFPPQMSPVVFEAMKKIEQNMEYLSSDHSGSLAIGQPNERSALQLGLRMEIDRKGRWRLATQLARLEEETTKDRIALVRRNWRLPFMLRIGGAGEEVRIRRFFASKISDGIDVQVQKMKDTAFSEALHEDKMLRLFQIGLFGDPRVGAPGNSKALKTLSKGLDIKSDSPVHRVTARAENQAKEETEWMLANGKEAPVYPWHDDEVHLGTHHEEMNHKRNVGASEQAVAAVTEHCKKHEMNLQTSLVGKIQRLMLQNDDLTKQLEGAIKQIGVERRAADIREEHAERAAALVPTAGE